MEIDSYEAVGRIVTNFNRPWAWESPERMGFVHLYYIGQEIGSTCEGLSYIIKRVRSSCEAVVNNRNETTLPRYLGLAAAFTTAAGLSEYSAISPLHALWVKTSFNWIRYNPQVVNAMVGYEMEGGKIENISQALAEMRNFVQSRGVAPQYFLAQPLPFDPKVIRLSSVQRSIRAWLSEFNGLPEQVHYDGLLAEVNEVHSAFVAASQTSAMRDKLEFSLEVADVLHYLFNIAIINSVSLSNAIRDVRMGDVKRLL